MVSNSENVHRRLAAHRVPAPWTIPDDVRGAFEIIRIVDGTAYISGHGPLDGTNFLMQGRIGEQLSVEDGYQSARLSGLSIVSTLNHALEDLDHVTWLRATVYVNASPGLDGPALTQVGNGFSDLIYELWQERGRHARATVGVSSLVFGVPTIVEAVVSLKAS